MHKTEVKAFFETLAKTNPLPKTELEYTNPFTLLVAVVLSAQSTDKSVNRVTRELFKVADTPQKMLSLGEDGLSSFIKTLGFYQTKTKNLLALSKQLIDRFNGHIPATREELMSLPGVGRKTANVVLNTLYHQPTLGVDTHVFRVATRTGLACGKTPEAIEKALLAIIPPEYLLHAHHWLVLHGRYICKARRPLCENCPVSQFCTYYHHVMSHRLKSTPQAPQNNTDLSR
jgi:endonuclease-3